MLHWSGPAKSLGSVLKFPYFKADGTQNGYCRLKPERPRLDDKDKPIKYEAPRDEHPHAYFPCGSDDALSDLSQPLLLTEGEKKALKATQEGFSCIGLSGVYSWRSKQSGSIKSDDDCLLPELKAIAWKGRTIYIAFDHDKVPKPEVRQAERRLADVLQRRGAVVHVVTLPGAAGEKVGLDDFLVAYGPAALWKLLEESRRPTESQTSLVTTDACDVIAKPVDWLWLDRIAKGALTEIISDPEEGRAVSRMTSPLELVVADRCHPAYSRSTSTTRRATS